jgi:dolichol-phosphate mannosyltransferase
MPFISIVIPAHNEEDILAASVGRIAATLRPEVDRLELIVVDDGSHDRTAEIGQALARGSDEIRFVSFTRNFGKEAAIHAGLEQARGDAVIVMDADMQHPPEIAVKMVRIWKSGVAVVEAVKASRGDESFVNRLGAKGFYWVFRKISGLEMEGHSDYKLLDRVVVDAYLRLPERSRFFRGLVSWMGYPSAHVPFKVAERAGGASGWNRMKLLRYAIDNLTSFTSVPLRFFSLLGLWVVAVGVVFSLIALWQKIDGQALSGFTTVILLVCIVGGANLLGVGIIGHYLARIYDELKGRPRYLVDDRKSARPATAETRPEPSQRDPRA